MNDLISRQAAIEAVRHTIYEYFDAVEANEESIPLTYNDRKLLDLNKDISTRIKDLPAADVVEIVRCGECKYHTEEELGMVYCPHIVGGWESMFHFCSHGERRDE